ncbi:hypothetical protein, partial [Pseudomonas sp. UBA4617]|uniref:hypothetical protein n=1 Tax=Pseudomonas sp. UBA4617 TaxID=1947318 RepID=UPI0025D6B408
RSKPLSTFISTAADHLIEALPILPESLNSLIIKEFCASTTLEVGRIIRAFETASTFKYKKTEYRRKAKRGGLTASPLLIGTIHL